MIISPVRWEKGLNSVCFVQVNHLLLSKSYEKSADQLTFGRGEPTFLGGETICTDTSLT